MKYTKYHLWTVLLGIAALPACSRPQAPVTNNLQTPAHPESAVEAAANPPSSSETSAALKTKVLMHNVMLTEKPGFHLRVRWLRGEMQPTHRGEIASFDDPNSFTVNVEAGVIASSFSEISGLLNGGLLSGMPLQNVALAPAGQQIKLTGTLHKGVSMPVELTGDIGVAPDGRIRLHVVKIRVLKLPVKGLLHAFHVNLVDVVGTNHGRAVEVAGDDLYLDAAQIVPAPALRGRLMDAHVGKKSGDLITVFGAPRPEVMEVKQWRNFIRLYGGTLSFGKLTMHHTDLFLIDASADEWFNFDLTRYQEQLVNGRIQMTPQAGLRVFMPDIQNIPTTAANRAINLQWMKNRNIAPPVAVTP